MRRMRFFASRNAREILRDPISVGFGVAFPILLLLLLSFLNRHIPAEAHMTLFEPEQLAPGVSVFSLSFLALFSALLLSRDRSSALILRLYASPLTGRDFILGYLVKVNIIHRWAALDPQRGREMLGRLVEGLTASGTLPDM